MIGTLGLYSGKSGRATCFFSSISLPIWCKSSSCVLDSRKDTLGSSADNKYLGKSMHCKQSDCLNLALKDRGDRMYVLLDWDWECISSNGL